MHNMHGYFDAFYADPIAIMGQFGGSVEDYYQYYGDIQNILRSGLPEHPATSDYFKILDSYINKTP